MAAAPDSASAQQCDGSTCSGSVAPTCIDYALTDLGSVGEYDNGNPWLPGPDSDGTVAINNLGAVVFAERISNQEIHAWVWLPNAMYGLSAGRHDLTTIPEFSNVPDHSIARDINDDGTIVGQSGGSGPLRLEGYPGNATVWHLAPPGQTRFAEFITTVDGVGVFSGSANAINNDGDIAGAYVTLADDLPCDCGQGGVGQLRVGFLKPDGQAAVSLPSNLSPLSQSIARDVNINQTVGGYANCGGLEFPPPTPTMCKDSPQPECGSNAAAAELTVNGAVVLRDDASDSELVSQCLGVNDAGHFIGHDRINGGACPYARALFWEDEAECPCVLGDIVPLVQVGTQTRAEGINNLANPQVVGWNEFVDRGLHWERQSDGTWVVTDLDSNYRYAPAVAKFWTELRAHDVNDSGWIVGVGRFCANGNCPDSEADLRVFLLKPVVETGPSGCLGDGNGDNTVDVADLLDTIAAYGFDCDQGGPPCCPGDSDGNTDIDIDDLLATLDNWGACGSGAPPASLESELVAAGLPHTADDEYLNILLTGTQAQIDNYNCWVDHYLMECGVFCQHNCPDNDPWGRH